MKVISNSKKNGALLNVKVLIDDPKQYQAYTSALAGVKCPKCQEQVKPKPEDMCLLIQDPLTSKFGIDSANISTKCQKCGEPIVTQDEYELIPFPDVHRFIKLLRQQHSQQTMAERRKKNG